MTLLGVTGGIGMGKSASSRILDDLGVPHVDSDLLARECSAPGSDGLAEIVRAFGPGCLSPSGSLDRRWMAARVFQDRGARELVESILHPRIAARWRGQVAVWKAAGRLRAAVVIPLLLEKGYGAEFSRVICLACTRDTQAARLRERGWSDAEIAARNAAQLSVGEKMNRADFVIWTEGSLEAHRRQWQRILAIAS